MSVEIQHAMAGDRRAMARLLSAIENGSVSIRDVLPEAASIETGDWATMAITGAPGVGKSVLVDALMTRWAGQGIRVALLAVDPSSPERVERFLATVFVCHRLTIPKSTTEFTSGPLPHVLPLAVCL